MSYSVNGTTINLTRGDTFVADIEILDQEGEVYTPKEGDEVRFAAKVDYSDVEPSIIVNIPIETMQLRINPDDTKELAFGNYVYDIQLTTAEGDIYTFITKAKLKITEEVD